MNREELDILDKLAKGEATSDEIRRLNDKMGDDPAFKAAVEEHDRFLSLLKAHDERKALKNSLENFHQELSIDAIGISKAVPPTRLLWPAIAIAASVALVCIPLTLFVARWFGQDQQAEYRELRRNVERLRRSQNKILEDLKDERNKLPADKYSGTGFLISTDGYVVTSYHLIKGADSVYVENGKFGRHKTSVVYANPLNDIALLMLTDKLRSPSAGFMIRSREGDIGEHVYTLGFPRDEIVYGEGSISASSGYNENKDSYQISILVNPGNSGGPLFDEQGSVIGIVNGQETQSQGIAFAVKSGVLLGALKSIPADSLPSRLKLSGKNQLGGLNRVNQIRRLKDNIFIVKVFKGR